MDSVFLSIGSNKGNRLENIKKSIHLIDSESGIEIINKSKIYETQPMYNINQECFLNMVILIKTSLTPKILLKSTQKIEKLFSSCPVEKEEEPSIVARILMFLISNEDI